jgi:hypothetical protein
MRLGVSTQTDSCGRVNADGAASQMEQKPIHARIPRLFRLPNARRPIPRRLDEAGPDELLDDWMVSGPAAEPPSSR